MKLLDGVVKSDPENGKFLLWPARDMPPTRWLSRRTVTERALAFYTRAWGYGARGLEVLGVPPQVFTSDAAAMRLALGRLEKK